MNVDLSRPSGAATIEEPLESLSASGVDVALAPVDVESVLDDTVVDLTGVTDDVLAPEDEQEIRPSAAPADLGGDHARVAVGARVRGRLLALPFGVQVIGVIGVLLSVQDWPMFSGRWPLPTSFIYGYPVWSGSSQQLARLKNPLLRDLTTQQYPWQIFDTAALRSGHLPLWDPHILMGVPQVSSWLPAVFDPWHIGYLIMPTIVWWSLLFPLHQLAAGLGAALLARRLTGSRLAALAAGSAYALGGFVEGHNGQNQGEMACMLPFLILAIIWLADRPSMRRSAVIGLVLAVMVLVGHPETLLFSLLMAGTIAGVLLARLAPDVRRRFVGYLGLAALIAAGCSAAQWLPGLSWLTGSQRVGGTAIHVHVPALGALDLFSRDATSGVNSLGITLPPAGTYLGIATLWLAMFGLMKWRRSPMVKALAALALASGLVAFGAWPLYNLAEITPLVRGMRLDFLLMVTDLSLALLAAFGVSWLRGPERAGSRDRASWRLYLALLVGSVLVVVVLLERTAGSATSWFSLLHGPLGTALLLAATAVVLFPRVSHRRWAMAALILLMSLDLSTWSLGYHPVTTPGVQAYRTPPVLAALKRHDPSSTYRVLDVGNTVPLDLAIPYGYSDPVGYGPYQAATLQYWSGIASEPAAGHLSMLWKKVGAHHDGRVDLADVKYVLANSTNGSAGYLLGKPDSFRLLFQIGDAYVFRNLRDLGPAVVVPAAGVRQGSDASALALLKAPEPGLLAHAIVADRTVAPPRSGAASGSPGATTTDAAACGCVTNFRESADTVSFDVSARQRSLVVVSQNWSPGWHARINGHSVPTERADLVFDGLRVGPGVSHVVMVYEPTSVTVGVYISVASCALLALGLAATMWRRRRRATEVL